jgi:nicotinate-nucleotide adenylyltransferase
MVLAGESAWQLGLDLVLLIPTGMAPHKKLEDDPGAQVRAALAHRAAESAEGLEVSDLELRREGPSYTYETLQTLRAERPDAELVWLMGADAVLGLESWKRPERIVELARLGIAERSGVDPAALDDVLSRVGAREAARVEMPGIGISSSLVRERVREGRPFAHLVPDGVAEAISREGLYGG